MQSGSKQPRRTKVFLGAAIAAIFVFVAVLFCSALYVRGAFVASRPVSEVGRYALTVGSHGHRITGREYLVGPPTAHGPLVVVLHGDAPTRKPSYQYVFAKRVANANPGIHAIALLRPGFGDPFGGRSDGDRGNFATGDNYTADVVNAIADALLQIKSRFGASEVILVGHSGGAALAADVAALRPGLVQKVFLIGCPCDVPAFREHMAQLQHNPLWRLPTRSISPIETIQHLSPGLEIRAITGSDDQLALSQYARAYIQEAREHGINASLRILPNLGHEILLEDAVLQEVTDVIHK